MTDLVLQSIEQYQGNLYEPRHTRSVYFDPDSKEYVAQAAIGDAVLVVVTGPDDADAWMTLAKRLVEVFRAMRAAA